MRRNLHSGCQALVLLELLALHADYEAEAKCEVKSGRALQSDVARSSKEFNQVNQFKFNLTSVVNLCVPETCRSTTTKMDMKPRR